MARVIVIGTGGIGKRHIRGLRKTGRAEMAFVEPHAGRREEAVRLYTPQAAYASVDEADLSSFDLAVICAPAHMHVPLMSACARAGLPFLVEKPLAVTMEGVDEALALVKQAGIEARVGYIRRIAPELIAAHEAVAAGKIGALKLIYSFGGQEFPKYRPDYRETYYSRPEMGGGVILDGLSHSIDYLMWFLGRPVTVMAMYDHLVLDGSATEDTACVAVRFESGAMAYMAANQFQKPNVNQTDFIGTKGNLRLEFSTLSFADDDSGSWKEPQDFMDGLVPTEAHEARFALQASEMLDAIGGAPCQLTTLDEARTNLKVALAAKQSWVERRIIDIEY